MADWRAQPSFEARLHRAGGAQAVLASRLLDPVCASGVSKSLIRKKSRYQNEFLKEQAMPVAAYSQPGNYLGKYRLVRLVGEGGMGRVWEAIDPDIDRRVAIKILHPEHTHQAGLVERFFNEARAVNRIQHSSLAQVSECALLPDGTAYIVMDLLLGETLRTRMERCGTMSIVSAIRTTRQIASAMSAAHRAGITHRDLKPENVMLVIDPAMPDGERVKILDFGIAKLLTEYAGPLAEEFQTSTGQVLGTATYMAPEQCKGSGQVSDRADVYSLGVVMYRMCCGQLPFRAEGQGEVMAMHIFSTAKPLRERDPSIPEGLAELISRMMANHAKARTCAQFRCALAMGIPHSDCMIKIPTLRIVRPLSARWTTLGPQGKRWRLRHLSARS